jgi:uncharacterized membrane protein YpjA
MHTPGVSDHARVGLGILAAAWFFPVLAWAFLAQRSEVRMNASAVVLLVHRGLPAIVLGAAVIIGSWDVTWAAIALGLVTAVTVEVVKRRWPAQWDAMGSSDS